jgi:DNA helicase-2/ATP-dependent DNA helicase PcrA
MSRLSRAPQDAPAPDAVRAAATSVGWDPDTEPEGAEEATRQADLSRLVRLATDAPSVREFLDDLRARFGGDDTGRGVVLSTYHRAKGLEWEAVFLPRLEERELPFALARGEDDVAEERRLLYVGTTRARRHLRLSWCGLRGDKAVRRSRFVNELVPDRPVTKPAKPPEHVGDPDLFARLRSWRKQTAEAAGVPAYVVFHDATLREICERKPSSLGELGTVAGIGPTKLARYGPDVIEVVGRS